LAQGWRLAMKRGRPPLDDEPATKVIRVRVTPAQRLRIHRVASENGTDLSGVIREAIDEYVSDYDESPVFRRTRARRRLTLGDMANEPTPTNPTPNPGTPNPGTSNPNPGGSRPGGR
jgi:hypothetical protein